MLKNFSKVRPEKSQEKSPVVNSFMKKPVFKNEKVLQKKANEALNCSLEYQQSQSNERDTQKNLE